MRIIPVKCRIYEDSDDGMLGEMNFTRETLFLDVDKVGSFHAGNDGTTIVYLDGVSHEICMKINDFARLKLSNHSTPPAKDRFITMFSNN